MNINVVLRTCDRVSMIGDRIVSKNECVIRCLNSLVKSLKNYGLYTLHIIDDNSSQETKEKIVSLAGDKNVNFLPPRDEEKLNNKQKSRFSVKVAYDYIKTLPENDLVYVVEDDYLHYDDTIEKMIEAWKYFSKFDVNTNVGIFPQNFKQLYLYPENELNVAYVRPCIVAIGPDRFYRTTWFTHESFMIQKKLITQYSKDFDELVDMYFIDGKWEGNTISNVWSKPNVKMMMPMKPLVFHVSTEDDLFFHKQDFEKLWEENKI